MPTSSLVARWWVLVASLLDRLLGAAHWARSLNLASIRQCNSAANAPRSNRLFRQLAAASQRSLAV